MPMGGIISSGLHVAHERQDARLEGAELAEALALADLLGPERAQQFVELSATRSKLRVGRLVNDACSRPCLVL